MRLRTGTRPGDWADMGPSSAPGSPVMAGQGVAWISGSPATADPARASAPADFTGPIARTGKGMLHRLRPDGTLHPRCAGGRTVPVVPVSEGEAMEWADRHSAALCRYRWCFRAVVASIGINPEVGHFARIKRRIS